MIMNSRLMYPLGSFVAGFVLMAFEILSARIIAPLVGNSLYSWAAVIGVTLLGLSLGSYGGGILADKKKVRGLLVMTLIVSSVFLSAVPLIASYLTSALVPGGIVVSSLVYAVLLFFPASLSLGAVQPLLLKEYTTSYEKLGQTYGLLSMMWSLGSIVGVFVTGFVLISFFSVTTIILGLSFVCYIYALLFTDTSMRQVIMLALILGMILFIAYLVSHNKHKKDSVVVFQKDTPYYQIKIVDFTYPHFGFTRSLFLDYDQHSSETANILPYAYTNSFPIFGELTAAPKNILVLGGGAYTLPKKLASYYKTDVDVFELDPQLPSVVQEYFGYATDTIHTATGDARMLLKSSNKKYDLIFGDVYNSFISIPYHTATKEYYQLTKKRLHNGGIYAMSFASPEIGGENFLHNMIATFSAVYPNYYIFSFTNDKKSLGSIILVGVNSPVETRLSERDLKKRLKSLGEYSFLANFLSDPEMFYSRDAIVFTDDYVPIETQMEPFTSLYFQKYSTFLSSMFAQEQTFRGVVKNGVLIFEKN